MFKNKVLIVSALVFLPCMYSIAGSDLNNKNNNIQKTFNVIHDRPHQISEEDRELVSTIIQDTIKNKMSDVVSEVKIVNNEEIKNELVYDVVRRSYSVSNVVLTDTNESINPSQSHNNQDNAQERARVANKISSKYNINLSLATNIVNVSYNEAKNHNVDPLIVLSIIATESSFNPRAYNKSGATGLMQVIPRWHQDKIQKVGAQGQLYSINHNVKIGVMVLREYLNKYNGNLTLALQQYNGSLHDKSRRYTNKVISQNNWLKN